MKIHILALAMFLFVAPSEAATIRIGMFGDSVTQGSQEVNGVVYNTTAMTIPAFVDYLLEMRFPQHDFTVDNMAKGGTSLYEMVHANRSYGMPFATVMSSASPKFDIVTFAFGLNDGAICNPDPAGECRPWAVGTSYYGRVQVRPYDWRSLLRNTIDIARNAGAIPVVVEETPSGYLPCAGCHAYQYVYQQRQAAAAKGAPLVSVFDYLQTFPDWKSVFLGTPGPGNTPVHMNNTGHAIVAQRIVDVLTPIIEAGW